MRVDLGEERLIAAPCASFRGRACGLVGRGLGGCGGPLPGLASGRETAALKPTFGGELPEGRRVTVTEACAVKAVGDAVFEASCLPATKGQFVFAPRRPGGLRCGFLRRGSSVPGRI